MKPAAIFFLLATLAFTAVETSPAQDAQAAAPANVKAYQNYDFTPGDTILFADDLIGAQDGEFPARWELAAGQGVVNNTHGFPALMLTDGNYVRVAPRIKNKSYLGAQYTIEYDTLMVPGAYGLMVFLKTGDDDSTVSVNASTVEFKAADDYTLSANMPASLADESYVGQWHHIAIAVKAPQLPHQAAGCADDRCQRGA